MGSSEHFNVNGLMFPFQFQAQFQADTLASMYCFPLFPECFSYPIKCVEGAVESKLITLLSLRLKVVHFGVVTFSEFVFSPFLPQIIHRCEFWWYVIAKSENTCSSLCIDAFFCFQVTGKCGSVVVRLIPAPRGTGIVSAPVPKKLLHMAGIDDCYTSARGQTATLGNFGECVALCKMHSSTDTDAMVMYFVIKAKIKYIIEKLA